MNALRWPRALLGAGRSYARIAWWGLVAPRLLERDELQLVQAVLLDPPAPAARAPDVWLAERSDLRGLELPGGRVEAGEDDAGALRRELREELGVEIEIEALVGHWVRRGFRPHTARVYRCRLAAGSRPPTPRGDETQAVVRRPLASAANDPELLPWYREALERVRDGGSEVLERCERQGLASVWQAARIDLARRLRAGAAPRREGSRGGDLSGSR